MLLNHVPRMRIHIRLTVYLQLKNTRNYKQGENYTHSTDSTRRPFLPKLGRAHPAPLAPYLSLASRCASCPFPNNFTTSKTTSENNNACKLPAKPPVPRIRQCPGHHGSRKQCSQLLGRTLKNSHVLPTCGPHSPLRDFDKNRAQKRERPRRQCEHWARRAIKCDPTTHRLLTRIRPGAARCPYKQEMKKPRTTFPARTDTGNICSVRNFTAV